MAKLKLFLGFQQDEVRQHLTTGFAKQNTLNIDLTGEPREADYCLVDENIFNQQMASAELAYKCLVISHSDVPSNIKLMAQTDLNHIIGFNSADLIQEIIRTIQSLEGGGIWGVERYLSPTAMIESKGINDSREITPAIEQAINSLSFENFFDSPVDSIRLMANELLTNALYNASVSKAKLYPHQPVDRKSTVSIKASEHILFKIGVCDQMMAISVQDSFGSLTRENVVQNLYRSAQEKKVREDEHKGGAGLGLFLIYNYANQLIVNLKKGVKTEVICLIDANKRYKKYKERITSFHLFEEV